MKGRKIAIIVALALCAAFVSCKKADKKSDAPTEVVNNNDALLEAARCNDITEVQRLIESGADVDAKDDDGMTALMYAARRNEHYVARLLIEAGADVNAKDNHGLTALMIATADDGVEDVIPLLKAAGAETEEAEN